MGGGTPWKRTWEGARGDTTWKRTWEGARGDTPWKRTWEGEGGHSLEEGRERRKRDTPWKREGNIVEGGTLRGRGKRAELLMREEDTHWLRTGV